MYCEVATHYQIWREIEIRTSIDITDVALIIADYADEKIQMLFPGLYIFTGTGRATIADTLIKSMDYIMSDISHLLYASNIINKGGRVLIAGENFDESFMYFCNIMSKYSSLSCMLNDLCFGLLEHRYNIKSINEIKLCRLKPHDGHITFSKRVIFDPSLLSRALTINFNGQFPNRFGVPDSLQNMKCRNPDSIIINNPEWCIKKPNHWIWNAFDGSMDVYSYTWVDYGLQRLYRITFTSKEEAIVQIMPILKTHYTMI
jgi:hypothetical protein